MRWRIGSLVGGALSLVLVAGCVSEQGDNPEPEEDGEDAAEEEPQISDADLSGLTVLHSGNTPIDPDENPAMILAFYDPADGSLRTSLSLRALEEDTEMASRTIDEMMIDNDGNLPVELDFSADFRRMAWENSETGAVHVAELVDETAEYQLLRSFEIDVGATISGDQPRYRDVNLSPDGSELWFVSSPGDDEPGEIVFAQLDDETATDQEPESWGEEPAAENSPGDGDAYWDVTWGNELQILERDTTSEDDYTLDFYADGDEIVPTQLTIDGLGARTGAHNYHMIRQAGADAYTARVTSASDAPSQVVSFRVTEDHEVTDIELLAESETYMPDAYPDLDNNDLLVVELDSSYRPFYARSLDGGDEEPRLRFDDVERREELEESMFRQNILGVYPEDKSESAIIPQLR